MIPRNIGINFDSVALNHTWHVAIRNMAVASVSFRWVSERTLGWLHNFRRLRIRFDRRADIHHVLEIAESVICVRVLQRGFCYDFLVGLAQQNAVAVPLMAFNFEIRSSAADKGFFLPCDAES